MEEKTVSSTTIYSGKILNLRVDTVEGTNGLTTREIVEHVDAVCILPFESPGTVHLIQQYRKAIEATLIEAPAGCMAPNETPLNAAKRELKEETGFEADQWVSMGSAIMAPGFCTETIHFFMATGLTHGPTNFDTDEWVTLATYPMARAMAGVNDGHIIDAKTIIALGKLNEYLQRQRI